MFVYMCSGDITEVRDATSVVLTAETLLLYAAEKLIARFPRADVSFCSRMQMAPVPC
jgi:hypothetical protein